MATSSAPAPQKKQPQQQKQKDAAPPAPAPAPATKAAEPTPAPATKAAEPAPAAEAAAVENGSGSLLAEFAATLKSLTAQFKTLQTQYTRMEKEMQKKAAQTQKRQNRGENSKKGVTPPGFMKPVRISKELCTMLGKPDGTVMPRNEVNNAIHDYIRENKLQSESDRRSIVPDAKLVALFKPGTYNPDEIDPKTNDKKKLTHFVLQGLIKHHFIKIDDSADKEKEKEK